MPTIKNFLIHACVFTDQEDELIEHSVVSCIDVLADDRPPGLIVVKGSVARDSYVIERKRIRFDGGYRKAGSLFRSLDSGGELQKGLVDVYEAWTQDQSGLIAACERVTCALRKLPRWGF